FVTELTTTPDFGVQIPSQPSFLTDLRQKFKQQKVGVWLKQLTCHLLHLGRNCSPLCERRPIANIGYFAADCTYPAINKLTGAPVAPLRVASSCGRNCSALRGAIPVSRRRR